MFMNYNSIIMSGLPGSGKSTLSKRLSDAYGWPVYSIGQLFRDRWKELYPDGGISFEEYWRSTTLEDLRNVNLKAREIFEKGSVIGDSRYSIYCMDLPCLLIFITANLDTRAKRAYETGKYKGMTPDEIKRILRERENDEIRTGETLFGYDYRDPLNYHLVI